VAVDPKLLWMYVALAIAAFIGGCLFWVLFHRYNATEQQMNALEVESDGAAPVVPATARLEQGDKAV
jgi:POT family proton-dependent oligopeptide transporter